MTTTHYTVQIIYQEELERPKWHPKKCEHATFTVIRLEVLWEMPKFKMRYHTLYKYKTSILVFESKTVCNWLFDLSDYQ